MSTSVIRVIIPIYFLHIGLLVVFWLGIASSVVASLAYYYLMKRTSPVVTGAVIMCCCLNCGAVVFYCYCYVAVAVITIDLCCSEPFSHTTQTTYAQPIVAQVEAILIYHVWTAIPWEYKLIESLGIPGSQTHTNMHRYNIHTNIGGALVIAGLVLCITFTKREAVKKP